MESYRTDGWTKLNRLVNALLLIAAALSPVNIAWGRAVTAPRRRPSALDEAQGKTDLGETGTTTL